MSTPLRIALALFALFFVSACREIIPPSPDGGGTDLGTDMGELPDLGLCGMCGSTAPHCNADADGGARCVECINDTHCGAGHCDPESNTCVACFEDTHCLLAATSRCNLDTHSCAACDDNTQCEHITGKNICATEGCVECTHEERDACADGANVCNSTTHECEDRVVNTRGLCEECVSDDDCMTGRVCVEMGFASTVVGQFCLFDVNATSEGGPMGSCTNVRAYTNQKTVSTVDGQTGVAVCAPLESTTCPALNDYRSSSCSAATTVGDAECGADGADAYCRMVDASTNLCTVPCAVDVDCKTGATCSDVGRCIW